MDKMNKQMIEELKEIGYVVKEIEEGCHAVSKWGFTVAVGGDRPQLKQLLWLNEPTTTVLVIEKRFNLLSAAREALEAEASRVMAETVSATGLSRQALVKVVFNAKMGLKSVLKPDEFVFIDLTQKEINARKDMAAGILGEVFELLDKQLELCVGPPTDEEWDYLRVSPWC